jgi:hypothetical protein
MLEDPFTNCKPSNPNLLEAYNRKKQPSDPAMPCINELGCPCWSLEELAGLRYQSGDPDEILEGDLDEYGFRNFDGWSISYPFTTEDRL